MIPQMKPFRQDNSSYDHPCYQTVTTTRLSEPLQDRPVISTDALSRREAEAVTHG
jgi:hypothetical protein